MDIILDTNWRGYTWQAFYIFNAFIYVCIMVIMVSRPEYPNNGFLSRYVELRVAHAQGMPGTFPPSHRVSDPDMHHDTCETHVPWCMPGSLASSFLCRRWREKRFRHSWRMRNTLFYVSGKIHIAHMVDSTVVMKTKSQPSRDYYVIWQRNHMGQIDAVTPVR